MENDSPKQPTAAAPVAVRLPFSASAVIAAKAAVSAVLAVICCTELGLAQPVWAAVSAVVVSQASLHPSARDSVMRVLANLVGAFVGAGMSALAGHSLWVLGVGILLTGLACHLARLDDALRPAFAAVVIVIFTTTGGAWAESLNRVFAVSIGCAATLAVGLAHHGIARKRPRAQAEEGPAGKQPE